MFESIHHPFRRWPFWLHISRKNNKVYTIFTCQKGEKNTMNSLEIIWSMDANPHIHISLVLLPLLMNYLMHVFLHIDVGFLHN